MRFRILSSSMLSMQFRRLSFCTSEETVMKSRSKPFFSLAYRTLRIQTQFPIFILEKILCFQNNVNDENSPLAFSKLLKHFASRIYTDNNNLHYRKTVHMDISVNPLNMYSSFNLNVMAYSEISITKCIQYVTFVM